MSRRTLFVLSKPMATPPESPAQADDIATSVPAPTVSQTHVLVRSNAIVVIAFIAVALFLQWAQAVLIPITLSVFLSYALTPVVNWLRKYAKLPKVVGAAATLAVLLGAIGWGLNSLQPEALDILDIVPRATQKFSLAIRGNPHDPANAVEKMKKAASEIEKAANDAGTTTTTKGAVAQQLPSAPETSRFKVREYVLMGTASFLAGMGQLVVVVALVYFLLVAGDSFRRTLIRISGDTLTKKKNHRADSRPDRSADSALSPGADREQRTAGPIGLGGLCVD